eukprot:Gregarina_sp_Poly_1__445@NODE_1108_length_5078_cov_259_161046_g768_i0_p4_GENE_NODE_1108_length_5078_cov_259_161046_g768_i0NODE_1108_length_5078_cov_259_161046_g768_i0_p4_ORF_typecomplete_len133_score7_45Ctf8/PF09696_10/0_52_NODE_1108_length_5078_cov_259_161046_g768_i046785019
MKIEGESIKVQLHPIYGRASQLYNMRLIELPKFGESDEAKMDGLRGSRAPLYHVDFSSTPPRLIKGNKEYLGREEVLQRPLLLVLENRQDKLCSIVYVVREKFIFDKGPIYHW